MTYTARIVRMQQIAAALRLAAEVEKFRPIYEAIGKRWGEIVKRAISSGQPSLERE